MPALTWSLKSPHMTTISEMRILPATSLHYKVQSSMATVQVNLWQLAPTVQK